MFEHQPTLLSFLMFIQCAYLYFEEVWLKFNEWKQLWSRTFLQHYCYALDKTVLTLGNDRPNSNHRKTIVFALIIAFRNFENCGSIELMKISILFFKYWKFSPSDWNFQINLLFNELQFLGNGKVSLHIKMRTRF